MSLYAVYRKEWMELLRSYRLLVVVVVLLFFGLTSPIITKFTPELLQLIPTGDITIQMPPQTVFNAIDQYVKNMEQFGIILALLLSMGAVAQEKDKGTAAMMLVKPLSRWTFLSAKFLSLATLFAIGITIAGIAAYYYTMLLFEAINILHWLVLNAFLLMYVLVIEAITLFCSTLTRTPASAAGISISLLALGLIAGTLGLGKYLPGELLTWSTRLMRGDSDPSWAALGVSVGVIVVSLLGAWLIFRRQEL